MDLNLGPVAMNWNVTTVFELYAFLEDAQWITPAAVTETTPPQTSTKAEATSPAGAAPSATLAATARTA